MKIHERYYVVRDQASKLSEALHKIVFERDGEEFVLTSGEQLAVVSRVFGDWLSSFAKYAIREERHPEDPDKKGDEA
jgi:hypothetical protein